MTNLIYDVRSILLHKLDDSMSSWEHFVAKHKYDRNEMYKTLNSALPVEWAPVIDFVLKTSDEKFFDYVEKVYKVSFEEYQDFVRLSGNPDKVDPYVVKCVEFLKGEGLTYPEAS